MIWTYTLQNLVYLEPATGGDSNSSHSLNNFIYIAIAIGILFLFFKNIEKKQQQKAISHLSPAGQVMAKKLYPEKINTYLATFGLYVERSKKFGDGMTRVFPTISIVDDHGDYIRGVLYPIPGQKLTGPSSCQEFISHVLPGIIGVSEIESAVVNGNINFQAVKGY